MTTVLTVLSIPIACKLFTISSAGHAPINSTKETPYCTAFETHACDFACWYVLAVPNRLQWNKMVFWEKKLQQVKLAISIADNFLV